MADKLQTYVQLAQDTARQLTSSYENWTSFLQTAARLNKYSYPDQLMIHAQRPDAVACASYDVWNQNMHRYVRRGSKGIALIDTSGEITKLKYVFDLSDTGAGRNARQPSFWQLREEHERPITEAIKERFDVGEAISFRNFLEETASILVADYWYAHKGEVIDIVDGSELADYACVLHHYRWRSC